MAATKPGAATDARAPSLSIGDLAQACGISVDTIRVWERRYGRPEPVRLPSGHRRYTTAHVRWLRRVAAAIASGHRAGAAVSATEEELDRILAGAARAEAPAEELDPFFDALPGYREAAILERLWDGWRRLGPEPFLEHVLAPLLVRAGRAWADGKIDIRHEHFLSEVIAHFLRAARASIAVAKNGRPIVLTTLPGELHGFGVQMAGIVAAGAGWRPHVLGVNTPLDEIMNAVAEAKAETLGISISLHTGGVESDRALAELRAKLPSEVKLVVGGAGARGARRGPRGIVYAETLAHLRRILRAS